MGKIEEGDLNAEAINAGSHYMKKKYDGAPMEAKQTALNACAHGFYMGVRWLEQKLSTEEKTNG